MTSQRRGVLVGGFVLSSLLSIGMSTHFGTISTSRGTAEATSVQGRQLEKEDATCDVTGVHASYGSSYSPTGSYLINQVVLRDVEATCIDATVSVSLLDAAGEALATGSAVAGSEPTVRVPLESPAAASSVARVAVEIIGGKTPVPMECGAFVPDRRTFGSLGDDTLVGGPLSDLMYGLTGGDRIRSGPNADCVEGGEGDDTVSGEAGDDFVIGRAGDDDLDGGPGRDQLFGGPGADTLRGGVGNDVLNGGDGDDRCLSGGGVDTFIDCEARS